MSAEGRAVELNLDGLAGPTHQYAGLAEGNLAAAASRASLSNPRAAALQGLRKMKLLLDLGVPQGVLPPQERPDLAALRRLGFSGSDADVLSRAAREAPELLAACFSSSSMWAANAATVCPSADSSDGKVHFTPANLVSNFHRSLEPPLTGAVLRLLFPESGPFVHHPPLPSGLHFSDEGAANHLRLCPSHGARGIQVFVFGRRTFALPGGRPEPGPVRYPARQAFEASAAVARLHGVPPEQVVFTRQSPEAIDAGAFHNDVVAVGNESLLLYHQRGFTDPAGFGAELRAKYAAVHGEAPRLIEVPEERLTLEETVSTYFFNSQLVTLPAGGMAFLAPDECRENDRARALVEEIGGSPPFSRVEYLDLRQSMRNGGGPACLRLRVVLNPGEFAGVRPDALLTPERYRQIEEYVACRYRDRLALSDLADPLLLEETRETLDGLSQLLRLGSIYSFQRTT